MKTPPSKREAASDEEALKVQVIIGDLDETGKSNSKVDWWSAQKQKKSRLSLYQFKNIRKTLGILVKKSRLHSASALTAFAMEKGVITK